MANKIHVLKTWPEHWDAVEMGDKTFEVRENDRDFHVGDVLVLRRFHLMDGYSTDDSGKPLDVSRVVTHIFEGGAFGVDRDYVVMSIKALKEGQADG